MSALLDGFLRPRKVALVGASRDPSSITARPLRYLRELGFPGEVVVVHPSAGSTLDGFPVVSEVAGAAGADVAMVMVPSDRVPAALQSCAVAGIDRAVVIASGFEGPDGAHARCRLLELLVANPALRILGPNCNGSLSIVGAVPLTFSSVLLTERIRAGRVALVVQSGAIGNAILLALARRGAGLSHLFSTGDELSIGSVELATALLHQDDTNVVALFLEGITDHRHLDDLARAVERTGKRVVAFRTSSSPGAQAAAFGHTGRVLGADELAQAALRAAGVDLVSSVEELCDAVTVLSVVGPPPRRMPARIGVVTVSGGAGVIAADAIGRAPGLALEQFSGPGLEALARVTPPGVAVTNPLDVPTLGAPEVFDRVLTAAAGAGCDAVVAVATTLAHDYEALSRREAPAGTPIVVTHLSPEERFTPEQARRLAEHGIATVPSARNAVIALSIWAGAAKVPATEDPGHEPPAASPGLGLVRAAHRLGARVGYRLAPMEVVPDAAAAVAAAARLGYPVALKAEGTAVPHRTERGAVAVGLTDAAQVAAAFDRIAEASAPDDVVVQRMGERGIEVFVSVVRDAEIGVAAVLRAGGVLVELGTESTVLVGRRPRWRAAIDDSALGRLLAGWRGAPAGDVTALLALLSDLVDAVVCDPSTLSVECNPVLVHPPGAGVTVVDVLLRDAS